MNTPVDISLFAVSPTNDCRFTIHSSESSELVSGSSPQPTPRLLGASTMKPLPPIPNQRRAALGPDGRSGLTNPSRCIIERMKRIRLMDARPSSLSVLSMPKKASKTIQQRRDPQANHATLTIPTTSTQRPQQRVASAMTPRQLQPPMIWLPEENVWLVAEATPMLMSDDARDLHGYYAPYAPAPSSDPIPVDQWDSFANPFDDPPSYDESTQLVITNEAEYSPVQTRFISLVDSHRDDEPPDPGEHAPTLSNARRSHEDAVSSRFQEAISGVNFVPRSEALIPGTPSPQPRPRPSRWYNRPDLTRSASPMCNMSPDSGHPDLVAPLGTRR